MRAGDCPHFLCENELVKYEILYNVLICKSRDDNFLDYNRACDMRFLHEDFRPHPGVDIRFSREKFYLCDHHSRGCMVSSQRM